MLRQAVLVVKGEAMFQEDSPHQHVLQDEQVQPSSKYPDWVALQIEPENRGEERMRFPLWDRNQIHMN